MRLRGICATPPELTDKVPHVLARVGVAGSRSGARGLFAASKLG